MEKRETSRQLRGRLQPNARNTLPPNIPLLRFKTQRNSRKCTREAKALRGRPRLQGKRRKVYFPLSCTPLRVLQREDYENLEKRSALLPTAYDKTSTGSYGVSFCSLSHYNLRHRGDFSISPRFLRNSTPNIGGERPL